MTNNLVLIIDEQLDKYAMLLAKRDELMRKAETIEIEYYKNFGKLIESAFKYQIECIRYKKMIAYCQARVNKNEKIDVDELKNFIERELDPYKEQLEEMKAMRKEKTERVSPYNISKVKRIYREIVKMIHPDLHPDLYQYAEIKQLWQTTVISYRAMDLTELENLKVQVAVIIKKITGDKKTSLPKVDNIKARIEMLEAEIQEILTTEPYTLRRFLDNKRGMDKRREELENDVQIYKNYLADLKKAYKAFGLETDNAGGKND